jgi:menaquinone-9 beta-reductase
LNVESSEQRKTVHIIGAGPAGSAAAIAARQRGAEVAWYDRSQFPRHRVCGEFLSPEVRGVLERLGAWEDFVEAGPSLIRRMTLRLAGSEKRGTLPEPAFGLSRYALDALLIRCAERAGAKLTRSVGNGEARPLVVASGRGTQAPRGNRLFGFKAHFSGPQNDAVELYFFDGCYVGVSAIENGLTNVCGLGPETMLQRHKFDAEALVKTFAPLRERLLPMTQQMDWLKVGPLVFSNLFREPGTAGVYPAGDALSFVDPFTGSGLLSAMASGAEAGRAAAEGREVDDYLRACRRMFEQPFSVSTLFRQVLASNAAAPLLRVAPARLLFRFTRPKVGMSVSG